jgi:phage/plasmid-like protein (TIGR03299 family)
MAHLVENMAYVGQTPWHGLGRQLDSGLPVDEWVIQAGMDWRIDESPVRFISGSSGYLGEIRAFEDRKVLYRSDTQAPLSVVGQNYKVVQPREILEFYRDLTEKSGFELETAGVLKGGRKLWALAKTGQSAELKGNDVTRGYVLLATACDGTMATTAQFTSVRVVCNNTLTIAVGDNQGAIKIPHRSIFDAQSVKRELGISVSAWDEFMYQMRTLSERKITSHEAIHYLQTMFTDDHKHASTKTIARNVDHTLKLFNGKGMGSTLQSANGTVYGLLNSVTQFVDHERRARSQDNRLDSAWFGPGSQLKKKALKESLALVA